MVLKYLLKTLLLSLIFVTASLWCVFWATWDLEQEDEKIKTLKEMKRDIQNLENKKEKLESQWRDFRIGNEALWDLMRSNMTPEDIDNLRIIVTNFISTQSKINEQINSTLLLDEDVSFFQRELLLLKQTLYKELIPYIEPDRREAFIVFVESDLSYNEKSKEVATVLEEKNIEQKERIEEIEEKIQDNSLELRERIEKKVTEKLQLRLDEFVWQERFDELENSSKILLFDKMITKLDVKRVELESTLNPTSVIKQRVVLYEIVQEILQWYIDTWNVKQ